MRGIGSERLQAGTDSLPGRSMLRKHALLGTQQMHIGTGRGCGSLGALGMLRPVDDTSQDELMMSSEVVQPEHEKKLSPSDNNSSSAP